MALPSPLNKVKKRDVKDPMTTLDVIHFGSDHPQGISAPSFCTV